MEKSKYQQNKDKYIQEILKIPGMTLKNLERKMEDLRKSFKKGISDEGILFIILREINKNK